MAEISIIITVHDEEAYVSKCIESVLDQTFTDFELIIVDDGSSNNAGKICDEYQKKDSRINVIHQANQGPVVARKAGVLAANGAYVGFLDADDWIDPDYYEKLHSIIVQESVDVVACDRYDESENASKEVRHGFRGGRYAKEGLISEIYPNMIVNGDFFRWGIFPSLWDKLFKKDVIAKHVLNVDERIRMGSDASCVFPCLLNAESLYIFHECMYHYRQHGTSLVRSIVDLAERDRSRSRFSALYDYVDGILCEFSNLSNIRRQWLLYCLFLMVPRADVLYEGMDNLPYLFPFPEVKKGDSIIIYGMGLWGKRMYNWLQETGFCNVVGVADGNYKRMRGEGISALSPDEISSVEHDAIVVTSSYADARKEIVYQLQSKYPNDKICIVDPEILLTDETLNALGIKGHIIG